MGCLLRQAYPHAILLILLRGAEGHIGIAVPRAPRHNVVDVFADIGQARRTAVEGKADGVENGTLASACRAGDGEDAAGQEVLNMGMDFDYMKAQMSAYGICLYAQSECRLYSFEGQIKYDGSLDGSISMLIPLSQTRLIRMGDQKISEVGLK